ncbi:Proline--tRNA ligase [Colletotrichum orbiculare MAFF 240422]|uniref:Proline--tRNA ligase n=1 Tax=Colletotrichum orbiculare (strain 104-T / ATCC 96160 / CBS 514.97 / LARS 414 / MAFF 240422) TaxID=1213857 RepID=A0A484FYG7_COLOR|nr:Proline--tRNA ligase [Colletotrichum orbiculare MAFF 240422]
MRARALSTSHYLYWVLRRRLSLPKMMLLLPRRLCVSQRRLSSSLNCYQSRHILLTIGRGYRVDHGRNRLSAVWTPTGGLTAGQDEGAHDKLVRAGFLRQSHSGIFHVLPLGRRVQAKLESLIDHYMKQLGASKVALSTITSKELWLKSGRFDQLESEAPICF